MAENDQTSVAATQQKPQSDDTDEKTVLQKKIAKTKEDIQFIHRAERAMYEVAEDEDHEAEEAQLDDLEQQIKAA